MYGLGTRILRSNVFIRNGIRSNRNPTLDLRRGPLDLRRSREGPSEDRSGAEKVQEFSSEFSRSNWDYQCYHANVTSTLRKTYIHSRHRPHSVLYNLFCFFGYDVRPVVSLPGTCASEHADQCIFTGAPLPFLLPSPCSLRVALVRPTSSERPLGPR